jgi:hypothetical protein
VAICGSIADLVVLLWPEKQMAQIIGIILYMMFIVALASVAPLPVVLFFLAAGLIGAVIG